MMVAEDTVEVMEADLRSVMGRVAEEDAWLSYIPSQHPDYAKTLKRKQKFLVEASAVRQRLRQAKLDDMLSRVLDSRSRV